MNEGALWIHDMMTYSTPQTAVKVKNELFDVSAMRCVLTLMVTKTLYPGSKEC